MYLELISIFVFIFGTIIGSFLNVVIFRHGTGMGLGGRSRSMTTGRILKWYELIPIISFCIQRGRSRFDGGKISWQYPLVEAMTGLLFLVSFKLTLPILFSSIGIVFIFSFLFFALISCFCILVAVYDIKHMIIPNEFIYPLIVLSFIALFVSPFLSLPSLYDLIAGPLVALPFILLWFVSGGRWMGFADAKIALAIGWFLGISEGFVAILLSFWIGALVGIVFFIYQKIQGKNVHHIPFGPFLLTGLILTFLYNISMSTLISFLLP